MDPAGLSLLGFFIDLLRLQLPARLCFVAIHSSAPDLAAGLLFVMILAHRRADISHRRGDTDATDRTTLLFFGCFALSRPTDQGPRVFYFLFF